MQKKSLLRRGLRKVWAFHSKKTLANSKNWQYLRYYPAVIPTDALIQQWNASCWKDYQDWIKYHSLQTVTDWSVQHQNDLRIQNPPKLSIVTPVYNTAPEVLYECILSIRMQTYPYWQWILVDDASTSPETLTVLHSGICKDPRIKILFSKQSQGISITTNKALAQATGDYVIFLDHDDRLALDALSLLAREIIDHPDVDILYSDRDMLSEAGDRYFHLFKPDWSPETLLSGNYIFHLMCYRHDLLTQLQGLRAEYDGSQDYDLVLRAAETHPKVRHVPKVLYHWRQHNTSVSLNEDAKDYAFQAGIRALNDALKRRGIAGKATEIPYFSRGTYQLDLEPPDLQQLQLITFDTQQPPEQYADFIIQAIQGHPLEPPYIAILSDTIKPTSHNTLANLTAWLNIEGVGLATGKILNTKGELEYIGMAYNRDTTLMSPYQGFPQTEPGYMRISQIARNISAPHPYCVVFKRSVWAELQGFNPAFKGAYALLDFALRALQINQRSVIVPQCIFMAHGNRFIDKPLPEEQERFKQHWQSFTRQGDPYYNPNLMEKQAYMGLSQKIT